MDKASQKRTEILNAAYTVFLRKGFHSARIEDIAAEIGMSQGLFYRYFDSKLDIFTQIVNEIILRISEGIKAEATTAANTLEEYIDQMEQGVDRNFAVLVDDPIISKVLYFETLGIDEDLYEKIQFVFDLFAEYSSLFVRNGIEKGILRSDLDVKAMAFAHNAITFEAARRIARSENVEEAKKIWKKAIVDLMIRGTADLDALIDLKAKEAVRK
jgi:AcrR family transcriptional regulator